MSGRAPSERATVVVLGVTFLACVAALAFTQIVDTDTWTHLSYGRWIWTHGALPPTEPFITHAEPFAYQNWLFGLAYYMAYVAGGLAGVTVAKTIVITTVFAMLLALALGPDRKTATAVVASIVLFGWVMLLRERYVERPDTVMMLCLTASLLSLQAYVDRGSRWLYALPLVHWIWANSHTSILLMTVPFLAFLIGGWLQGRAGLVAARRWAPVRLGFAPGLETRQLRTIAVVFALSIAASLLTPYGLTQITHSIQAVQSDWWRQEIFELQRPTWATYKALYVLNALAVASFILNHRRISLVNVMVAVPMLVLSFEALRFGWFAAIPAVYLVRNLAQAMFGRWFLATGRVWHKAAVAGTALALIATAMSVVARLGPFASPSLQRPGIGVNHTLVPEGALAYMDRIGVAGQVFNLFQWGGYITWRDSPRRTAFIDGRGFRSDALLERTGRAVLVGQELDELQREFGFESMLTDIPSARTSIEREAVRAGVALSRPNWAIVYWDDLSMLWLRRSGPYAAAIERDEFHYALPYGVVDRDRLGDPGYRQGLLAELRRNVSETNSSRARVNLAFVLNEIDEPREALATLEGVRPSALIDFAVDAQTQRGLAYRQLGQMVAAMRAFESIPADARSTLVLVNLAAMQAQKGDRRRAIDYYEQVLSRDPGLGSVYRSLAEAYRAEGLTDAAERTLLRMQGQTQVNIGRQHFEAGTQAYLARDYPRAVAEFEKSIEANPYSATALTNLAYVHYDMGKLDDAAQWHRRALNVDPSAANSLFWLALIYRDRGDPAQAVAHWRRYLELEPTGVYSRRAKQEIEALGH